MASPFTSPEASLFTSPAASSYTTPMASRDRLPIGSKRSPPQFLIVNSNSPKYHAMLAKYPIVELNSEVASQTMSPLKEIKSLRSILMPVNENILKRFTRTLFESGLTGLLEEFQEPSVSTGHPNVARFANYVCRASDFFNKIKISLFPKYKKYTREDVAKYSETRNWLNAKIRCISWHPDYFKFAIASCDDCIRVYTSRSSLEPSIFRSVSLKWITCLSWRPGAVGELVAGCQSGLCHCTLDEFNRASSFYMNFHTQPNHAPVTSLQWNNDGRLLATASISDSNIIIWNIDSTETYIIRRIGTNCSLLSWSPDETALLSATVGKVFRIWSTKEYWKCERWTTRVGHIQSACWSPCSSFILYITSVDSILYRMQCSEKHIFIHNETIISDAMSVTDLSQYLCNNASIGSKPQAIDWDPSGYFLAIIFKDTPNVVVFNTNIFNHTLLLAPFSSITGLEHEHPSCISFQSMNHFNNEVVLCIGWSSGRLQFYPF